MWVFSKVYEIILDTNTANITENITSSKCLKISLRMPDNDSPQFPLMSQVHLLDVTDEMSVPCFHIAPKVAS
jgi:hypothetical protein